MTSPIFLDANVPIYAAGQPHPLKQTCAEILILVARNPAAFVTDAEVLQELLHRYRAQPLWPRGRAVVESFAVLMAGHIEPVHAADVLAAVAQSDHYPRFSARDLLHMAVMDRLGVTEIVTADHDFDAVDHIVRLDPSDLPTWQGRVARSASP